jgi:hypothetical protein
LKNNENKGSQRGHTKKNDKEYKGKKKFAMCVTKAHNNFFSINEFRTNKTCLGMFQDCKKGGDKPFLF